MDERLREVALTPDEYNLIVEQLKRAPNEVELGMLGVLWSEHNQFIRMEYITWRELPM